VAEQLGFEQLLGDRRAVERHEGFRARAEIVQAAGDQLLAAAGFATDQHVDRQARQVQHLPAQVCKPRDTPSRLDSSCARVGLFMQAAVFQDQPALVQGAAQAAEQGVGAEGFSRKS
jgi:hypothetical protein